VPATHKLRNYSIHGNYVRATHTYTYTLSLPSSFQPYPLSLSLSLSLLFSLSFKLQMAASESQPQPPEQHSQHLNFKTTVLKVSIHCEGCKRKVHKILQGIHGINHYFYFQFCHCVFSFSYCSQNLIILYSSAI
jgi:hypothetical protein